MNKEQTIKRFVRYAQVYTESNPQSTTKPSSENQWDLLKMLHEELQALGLESSLEESGNVFAKIPANCQCDAPKIGFLAHVDTAPEFTGLNVKPQIHENFDGESVALNPELSLSVKDFKELSNYKSQTLITSDGTTLLGADDKAGITEIMEVVSFLQRNPDIKHGEIRIGFTSDEEIGCGTVNFDVEKFDADFGFTIDGGELGQLEYENFNAAGATIKIQGRSVHPGTAKGQMINASIVANDIINLLPNERPENTELYEGFIHITSLNSTTDYAEMSLIIRDHDLELFAQKKELLEQIVKDIQAKYPKAELQLTINDQYFNMKEKVEAMPEIMQVAKLGFELAGVTPITLPIRGGTDGSNLSFKGLPCPNIFTGGHNFHGRFEYIPVESMLKAQDVILGIIQAAIK